MSFACCKKSISSFFVIDGCTISSWAAAIVPFSSAMTNKFLVAAVTRVTAGSFFSAGTLFEAVMAVKSMSNTTFVLAPALAAATASPRQGVRWQLASGATTDSSVLALAAVAAAPPSQGVRRRIAS